jgi:acetyl esterase/lipase
VLHWVVANAERHKFDVARIVLTGDSTGSHLALTTGMLTGADGFDRSCVSAPLRVASGQDSGPRVATIVNWSGASDVVELLGGPAAQAVRLHEALDRADVPNRLVTVPQGGHGGYTREQDERAWIAVRGFLRERELLPAR